MLKPYYLQRNAICHTAYAEGIPSGLPTPLLTPCHRFHSHIPEHEAPNVGLLIHDF
jgi:hypothetical protein